MDESIKSQDTFAYWKDRAIAAADRISKENYYPSLWGHVTKDFEAAKTKADLLGPFQEFWEALPDSPSIRRGPFFEVCELAEEYCFGAGGDPIAAERTIQQVIGDAGAKQTTDFSSTALAAAAVRTIAQVTPIERPFVDDEWAKSTCKIGQGEACCRYLTMGPNGWSCEKHSEFRYELDSRVAERTINAKGDNCEGRASR